MISSSESIKSLLKLLRYLNISLDAEDVQNLDVDTVIRFTTISDPAERSADLRDAIKNWIYENDSEKISLKTVAEKMKETTMRNGEDAEKMKETTMRNGEDAEKMKTIESSKNQEDEENKKNNNDDSSKNIMQRGYGIFCKFFRL